jgi:site-specific recombinase XerD
VSAGESLYIVGKILGHRQARTTAVYAHLAADPVQAAADRAARRISEALRHDEAPTIVQIITARPYEDQP